EKAESIGQTFEHAFGENEPALFGLNLQDLEDQLLLAEPREALHAKILGDLIELLDAHVLELHQIQRATVFTLICLGRATLDVEHPSSRLRRTGGPVAFRLGV